MKKIKIKPDTEMVTDIEATMAFAAFVYAKDAEKRKGVDVLTLLHNFAEALLLREVFVNKAANGQSFDYPGEEEIGSLVERACMLAVEMEE